MRFNLTAHHLNSDINVKVIQHLDSIGLGPIELFSYAFDYFMVNISTICEATNLVDLTLSTVQDLGSIQSFKRDNHVKLAINDVVFDKIINGANSNVHIAKEFSSSIDNLLAMVRMVVASMVLDIRANYPKLMEFYKHCRETWESNLITLGSYKVNPISRTYNGILIELKPVYGVRKVEQFI